jgi:hypothetical protein
MTKSFNSTLTGCAYSLNVPVEALDNWCRLWDTHPRDKAPQSEMERLAEEMANAVSQSNPLLAQRYHFLRCLIDKGVPREHS